MPNCESSGFVCSPHSVTHSGTRRWNQILSDAANFERFVSETFGYATFWFGPRLYELGYGCVDHASNLRCGLALATRFANVAGATELLTLGDVGRLCPRFDVSPIATRARGLPALM